jgi:hypothetical protein
VAVVYLAYLNSSLEDITEKLGLFSEDEKKFLAQSH